MQGELQFGSTVLQNVIVFHTRKMKAPVIVRNLCKMAVKLKVLTAVEAN